HQQVDQYAARSSRAHNTPKTTPVLAPFFTTTAPPETSTLSLHDALPISITPGNAARSAEQVAAALAPLCEAGTTPVVLGGDHSRSEEHTSELQSRGHIVCRLLLEKKKNNRSRL